jgi:hypothetical protein
MGRRLPFGLLNPTAACFLLAIVALGTGVAQNAERAGQAACAALQAQLDQLSQADRGLLDKHGVLLRWPRQIRRESGWIISPALVPSCETRLGISRYFRAALAGSLEAQDRAFVQRNRRELAYVLGHIWSAVGTSDAVPSDGAFNHEKWGILENAGLSSAELTPLLRRSLSVEGLSGSLVYFALPRRLRGLQGDLESLLRRERNRATALDRTSTTQIYCLALLYSLGAADVSSHLSELLSDAKSTSTQKSVILSLQTRIAAKQAIHWEDLEELEYEP